jgi:glutathione S-transferase
MSQYSTMQPLVLYDILSNLPGNNFSPNPAKPRFVLSYKEIPFVTIWVEYSDISIAMKAIGSKPSKRRDGSEVYTIPVLSDPNTGTLISDSLEIVSYLEKTYPEKPIFPNNSESLIRAFDSAYMSLLLPGIRTVFLRTTEILSPASAKFFIGARTGDASLPWDVSRDADWELLEKGYNTAYEWYQKTDGKWIMGNTFSYADIIVACWLLAFKRVLKADEWVMISSWNGGKWAQVLADVEKECKLA